MPGIQASNLLQAEEEMLLMQERGETESLQEAATQLLWAIWDFQQTK